MKPDRALAIEVVGITFQPPKRQKEQVEQKFNEAMEKIAVLTSEKEQLEHISSSGFVPVPGEFET